ncbi:MAG: hypothetical protein NUW01_04985 [Gemmatimonadaceae bacterium]|nr:hypothetical protein [Gemmatimonadaceae bacterium]
MSRLHVLTSCSRPGNLPAVAESIAAAASDSWEVCWHVRFDLKHLHVGGQQLKNDMLDGITDGWVVFLDDDTTMHPGLLASAAKVADVGAVIVSQERSDGTILRAARENLQVGLVDIGQAILRRDLIGDARIPIDYNGDGMFLAGLLRDTPAVAFVDEILSFHNSLTTAVAA